MGILDLFVTACMPVFNMLLVTGVGSFLASEFAGILGEEARKHLNNIVFYVFNPSLVSIYLAKTITMESFSKLWFMPVNIFLVFAFGSIFGWIVIRVTRAPAKLRGLVLGCCSAGNWGNLFLIVIPALCKEKGSPFGAPDVCQTYGLAYSSLSMAIGAICLWTFVYNIVRATSKVTGGDGDAQTDPTNKVLVSGSAVSEGDCTTPNEHENDGTLPLISKNIPHSKHKVPLLEKARSFFSWISGTVDLKKLFAPSTIAVIVGFIIGGTPPIRDAIIGDNAPLRVLQESAELIGGGAIPSVTLIMGANLLNGVRGEASVQPSIIVGVIVVRYILLPLLGTGLIKGAVRVGIIQPDPLYQFVLLLQYAVPPAMNIGITNEPSLPLVQGRSCSCSASGRASAPSSSSGFTRSRPSPSPFGPPSSCGRCLRELATEWRMPVYRVSALYRVATDKIASWLLFLERKLFFFLDNFSRENLGG